MQDPESGLKRLTHDNRVKKVCREGAFFWCAAASDYPSHANGGGRTEYNI
jgi:hypothetical protein